MNFDFNTADRELNVNTEEYTVNLNEISNFEGRVAERVRAVILTWLKHDAVSDEINSEGLGLNVHTLIRKLKAEGSTYGL